MSLSSHSLVGLLTYHQLPTLAVNTFVAVLALWAALQASERYRVGKRLRRATSRHSFGAATLVLVAALALLPLPPISALQGGIKSHLRACPWTTRRGKKQVRTPAAPPPPAPDVQAAPQRDSSRRVDRHRFPVHVPTSRASVANVPIEKNAFQSKAKISHLPPPRRLLCCLCLPSLRCRTTHTFARGPSARLTFAN